MRVIFKKRTPGQIEFGVIYGGIALVALYLARFLPLLSIAPSCAFKGLTGMPCPTCGSTRAVVHLSQGKLASALALNPAVTLVMIFAGLFFFYSLITLVFGFRRIGLLLTEREKKIIGIVSLVLLFLQWGWLARTL